MFYYILFVKFFTLLVIIADPGPTLTETETLKAPQSSYNYYGFRPAQLQTASPYLNKRNPDSHSNSQQSYSSVAPSYGKSAANQCKLHIHCPSKKILFYSNIQ